MSKVLEYIVSTLKKRQEFGLKKYNYTIDECPAPTGSFEMEVIQEVLDALQYMTRVIFERDQEIKRLEGWLILMKDILEPSTNNAACEAYELITNALTGEYDKVYTQPPRKPGSDEEQKR